MDIQVNNLNLSLIEADIQRLFTPYGEISSVEIIRDRWNNRSKGKAVVIMPVEQEAQKALASLQGVILGGKPISVNEVPNTDENRFSNSSFLR
jgi:RNA recognition motif-containing protein